MKKENRIKKNQEIACIVGKRQKISSKSVIIYYNRADKIFRVAISVNKKFGTAVERNHAKRIIREIIRPNIEKYIPMDLVVVIKPEFKESTFEQLSTEVVSCIEKIESRLINK